MKLFMNKEERKKYKEIKRKAKEEEKLLEEEAREFEHEYESTHPKEKANIFSLLFEPEVDEEIEKELDVFLTDAEREELASIKQENKVFTIKVVISLSCIIILFIVGLVFLSNYLKSPLEKVTIPLMEEYYQNKYGLSTKIDNIKELCVTKKDENNKNYEDCSGIYIAQTIDGNYISSINNESFGDNINSNKMTEEYKNYSIKLLSSMNIIDSNPIISYQDYYVTYNFNYDYINVLPDKLSLDELIDSNKLTVTDTFIYQGEFNNELVFNLLSKLSSDSVLYFIKLEKGLPIRLTIANKNGIWSDEINNNIKISKNITYYELSRVYNGVTKLTLSEIKGSDIELLDSSLEVKKAFGIKIKKESKKRDMPEKPSFYLLSFNTDILNKNDFIQFRNNYSSLYQEIEKDDYKKIVSLKSGGKIYLIGNSDLYFGITGPKETYLCKKFKIC